MHDTQTMHPMDHPMHLHGTFFQVVSENGQRPRDEEPRCLDAALSHHRSRGWRDDDHGYGGVNVSLEQTLPVVIARDYL
jgi:FtsP/CotA-like multicopper oxidase with cupredoxin domain